VNYHLDFQQVFRIPVNYRRLHLDRFSFSSRFIEILRDSDLGLSVVTVVCKLHYRSSDNLSRSVVLILAYLMKRNKWTLEVR
jgi:hypothetical protein